MPLGTGWSKTWTFFEGNWHEGNIGIMGPRTHAAWLCSMVFDGARAFEGVKVEKPACPIGALALYGDSAPLVFAWHSLY